ncbi:hypothetical protein B0H19DRAFT_1261559 [Mycena capillaripes]|nr:hypothetical protein B0H19DRAFT_1261559 [Mycena capillaripes]
MTVPDRKPSAHTGFMSNSTTGNREATFNGIFSGSQHFTVAGGTFSSVTNHYIAPPAVRSDFRMIPLGDIDLQYEIRLDKHTGVVDRSRERLRVRRVYSARVEGRESTMTVAMYQGHGAEDEWQIDMARYKSVRHPNIFQIGGAASSGNIYATLFLDLIPFEQFVDTYRHSSILIVYIHRYYHTEFKPVFISHLFFNSHSIVPLGYAAQLADYAPTSYHPAPFQNPGWSSRPRMKYPVPILWESKHWMHQTQKPRQ